MLGQKEQHTACKKSFPAIVKGRQELDYLWWTEKTELYVFVSFYSVLCQLVYSWKLGDIFLFVYLLAILAGNVCFFMLPCE